jgi:hypothetical protein
MNSEQIYPQRRKDDHRKSINMVFRWQCHKQQKGSLEFGMLTARPFKCKWLKWKVLTWWELLFFSFFNHAAFNSGSHSSVT